MPERTCFNEEQLRAKADRQTKMTENIEIMTKLCELYLKRKGEDRYNEILSRETNKSQMRKDEITIRKQVSEQLKETERATKTAAKVNLNASNSTSLSTTKSSSNKRSTLAPVIQGECQTYGCD